MMPAAPQRVGTARLVLRRPVLADAEAIFARYAADPDVTRFVAWPTHRSIDDTRTFLASSDAEWDRWGVGAYLALSRADGVLLGSTGLSLETKDRAQTGYVLAKDVWGRGLATEALRAMIDLGRAIRLRRLFAYCHVDHRASAHVLEKCGFEREGLIERFCEFPNLRPGEPGDVLSYARIFPRS